MCCFKMLSFYVKNNQILPNSRYRLFKFYNDQLLFEHEVGKKLSHQSFLLQALDLNEEELSVRETEPLDIAFDELPSKYYKKEEVKHMKNTSNQMVNNPTCKYMFKVHNKRTDKCVRMLSILTIKTPKWRHMTFFCCL